MICAYLRASPGGQTLEHQEALLRAWLKTRGLGHKECVVYRDDDQGGVMSPSTHSGFAAVLRAIADGVAKRAVLFEFSHAYRDFRAYLQFLQLCAQKGCEIEFVGKGQMTFANSQALLVASTQKKVEYRGARPEATAKNENQNLSSDVNALDLLEEVNEVLLSLLDN